MSDDVDFSDINAPKYSGDGVDRSKYNFDDDGFAKATNSALLAARQQMQERIKTMHQDIIDILHPSDFDVIVDGKPVNKAQFEQR